LTAIDLFVSELQKRGVKFIATLCGHGLDPLLAAAHRAGLQLIDVRNEQTCAYIADAYGRLTRQPGVCAVSSGVAHVNALTGVTNAWFDGAPMLLLSGAGAACTAGMGHFQDLDQVALAQPVTRYSRTVLHPARIVESLAEAWNAAQTGPAHLMLPMDVQIEELEEDQVVPALPEPGAALPHDGSSAELTGALEHARAPLVIAGSSIFYAGSGPDLLRFCERFHIPVVIPIWDRGIVGEPSPVFMGVIGAATGGPTILSEADCIVLAGAEPDYRVGYLRPPAVRSGVPVFRCTRNWHELRSADHSRWLEICAARYSEFHTGVEQCARDQAGAGLHAAHLVQAIRNLLPQRPAVLIDGGSIGQWAHHLLCHDRYPGDWLTCGRSGVVGWGIGGAMAARLAFPDRPVILLSGDGAFTFNVADLECAARQHLGFVAIVADDEGWGITRAGHIRQFGEAITSSLGPIAFDRLAESMGARGVRVETPEQLAAELRPAIARTEVTVIHARITGGNP
jgi:acetolactate synthase-1/2/3 large subunit